LLPHALFIGGQRRKVRSLVKGSDVLELILKGVRMGVDITKDIENLRDKEPSPKKPYNLDQLTDDLAATLRAKDEGKSIDEAVKILQVRKVPDSIILKIIGKIYGGK